ncbi:MAG: AAA family ATPase [Verrucomicrobiaceae bacterium]|nr:AAA family ATPase [Verrucomicrobiaceae bacterium]
MTDPGQTPNPGATPPEHELAPAGGPVPLPEPAIEHPSIPSPHPDLSQSVEILARMRMQILRVLYGQDELVDQVLAGLVAGGHVLIEGKPGLGKTHLVLTLAKSFGGNFGRIQFTPDLMPSDITGHTLFDMSSQTFRVRKGPVFTNLLLADEINRAPAKTQAALLEVMQENQVTIDGDTMKLNPPFMVLATQNPIEQDGTYPLPEAQLDRFVMKILIDYPTREQESRIVSEAAGGTGGRGLNPDSVDTVCIPEDIIKVQQACVAIECVSSVADYAVDIIRATREATGVSIGAGTRGAISLLRIGKSYALFSGRNYVTPDDIKRATLPVLRHRVTLSPESAMTGMTEDDTLRSVVESVLAPRQ